MRSLLARGVASLRTRGVGGTLQHWQSRRRGDAATGITDTSPPRLTPPTLIVDYDTLRLPAADAPRASIVIPVYDQLPYTLACLQALAAAKDTAGFEVIVVDDGSSDASERVLPKIAGLRYHRNERNLGFVGACNAGAALAKGEYLVFLNNDTTPQPGWLDALLRTFADFPDTGLAGSKLVYPDGRLQEAGGIVFADGSGWNYGRFADPEHPAFNFVREVDYCSGAAIALPRALFNELGGFDTLFAPAYYEDTDLAMRVRRHGLKVRYQPASVVVHHEGVTAGTDTTRGVKAHQVTNQAKFLERWKDVLARAHQPPGTAPAIAADRRRAGGRRVLVLDACTPTPDRDSGSVRMAALLKLLHDECGSVVFFAENRAHDGRYTRALQADGVEVWWHPFLADVPRWLEQHGGDFDLVVGSRHYVLAPLLPLLRRHAARARIVFDTVDLHHLREQREAELAGDPARRRAAARTRRAELALVSQCDATWVVSPAEQALLAKEAPAAPVEVVSNIHDVAGAGAKYDARSGLLFVGSYRHPPNVDAALWLADEILPRVHAQLPDVVLNLVGGDAPPPVQALATRDGIVFHGYVPDVVPLLEGCRVGVAPLRYGAGVKGKVNHALAHGQPVVATTCAVEGMHLHDGDDVLIADDAETFADAVVRLYRDPGLWHRLAAGGLENTRRHFSVDAAREAVRRTLARFP
ncbi:glycosyltransferase [Arenimonas composti]